MPIIRYTRNADAVPADAVNVRTAQYGEHTFWVWDTFVGRCVVEREANGYNDSDFYMVVEVAPGEFQEMQYATTRAWCYPAMQSCPDATPDVLERYAEYTRQHTESLRRKAAYQKQCLPAKGKRVRVVKGRKVPVGTEGVVFWVGETGGAGYYNRYAKEHTFRIGIQTDAGERVFTDMRNTRVVTDAGALLPVVYLSGGPLGWWVLANDPHATVTPDSFGG